MVTTNAVEPIAKLKLSDQVLERLFEMIRSGAIQPGGNLPSERELMARFAVGRPAVREALQALDSVGLIEIHHGERARLLNPDPRSLFDAIDSAARILLQICPQTLDNLREARLLFEVGMVKLAVRRATDEDLHSLAEALDNMRASKGNAKAFVAADMTFHSILASCSRNPLFAAISESLLRWLFQHYPRLVRVPGAEHLTISEHQLIYDRVTARDQDGAAQAMTDHLVRANPLYRQYVDTSSNGSARAGRKSNSGKTRLRPKRRG